MEPPSIAPNLDELLDGVRDERSFVAFVEALGTDFALEHALERQDPSPPFGAGKLGWENGTVDAVLEAAAAWGKAKLALSSLPAPNPWQRCALILYAGKFYE